MKSLMLLWKIMAEDLAMRCHTSATMDMKTVQGRVKHEGLSFLTITLPAYGKDFQKALDVGSVSRDSFQGFTWRAGLPVFLQGFLENVFARGSGVLLDEPDVDAIFAIRQLTLTFSKLFLPCSDARERDAMSGYIQCEREVSAHNAVMKPVDFDEFHRMSELLFGRLFTEMDSKIYNDELVPKHGPGATADKLRGNSKYRNRTWTDRLEKVFYAEHFLFPNVSYYAEHYDDITFLEPGDEMPVKVISVPKTQKTPRIIAIEPTCMQYAQQAMLEAFVQGIEGDNILSNLIGFELQEPNQLLAREGSLSGNLATLDLSEASDRVSWKLVQEMTRRHPYLQQGLDATRSRSAAVPGNGIVPISKYASMGSALCFPVEAMAFLVMVFLGIERELKTRFTNRSDIRQMIGRVRIYGDDIICPVDSVTAVISSLERFGARVGMHKSFWTGRFRESCGKDYYDGHDVSVVKVRRMFPSSRKDAPEVISIVSLRNQLYKAGLWHTVKWLDSKIEGILHLYPYVEESSSVLGRMSFLGYDSEKTCEHLHAPLVKGYVVSSRLPKDKLEGPGALLKYFLKRGNLPVADGNHLERSGRPRAVDIKPRWRRPY